MKKLLSALPIAALLLSLVPGIPVRADDSVDALLAKHKAFVGFSFGDGSITSLDTIETRTLDKDASVLGTTHTIGLGILFRADTQDYDSKTASSDGFTGNIKLPTHIRI